MARKFRESGCRQCKHYSGQVPASTQGYFKCDKGEIFLHVLFCDNFESDKKLENSKISALLTVRE